MKSDSQKDEPYNTLLNQMVVKAVFKGNVKTYIQLTFESTLKMRNRIGSISNVCYFSNFLENKCDTSKCIVSIIQATNAESSWCTCYISI